jgi:hypothetical protein
VNELWLNDLESLEAISQDDYTRRLCIRMAQMSRDGRLGSLLREADGELDDRTVAMLAELAGDTAFLHAVDEYVHRTRPRH